MPPSDPTSAQDSDDQLQSKANAVPTRLEPLVQAHRFLAFCLCAVSGIFFVETIGADLGAGLFLVSCVAALAIWRIAGILGYQVVLKLVLTILTLVPVIQFIPLIYLVLQASKTLRAAGVKVRFYIGIKPE